MTAALSFLTSRLGLSIGVALLILISVFTSYGWGVANHDRVQAEESRDQYYGEIHTPKTGYKNRINACEASVAGLGISLQRQNAAVDEMARAMTEQTAKAQAAVDAAQNRALAAQQRANALLFEQPDPVRPAVTRLTG